MDNTNPQNSTEPETPELPSGVSPEDEENSNVESAQPTPVPDTVYGHDDVPITDVVDDFANEQNAPAIQPGAPAVIPPMTLLEQMLLMEILTGYGDEPGHDNEINNDEPVELFVPDGYDEGAGAGESDGTDNIPHLLPPLPEAAGGAGAGAGAGGDPPIAEETNDDSSDDSDDEPINPLFAQLIGQEYNAGSLLPPPGIPPGIPDMVFMNPYTNTVTFNPFSFGGGFGGGLMSLLGGGSINYFANANPDFKGMIGDNKQAQNFYNCCCKIIMGNNRDFVGWFTDYHLCKTYDLIHEYYHIIMSKLYDAEAEFFDFIFVPTINGLYEDYRKRRDIKARKALEECIHTFEDGVKVEGDCCICMCSIQGDDSDAEDEDTKADTEDVDRYVSLPCKHVYHYDCVRKWFAEQLTCPECRYSLEEGKVPKEKKNKKKESNESKDDIIEEDTTAAPTSTTHHKPDAD